MKHPRSNKGSLRQAIAPIIDRLEDRRLLSAVFEIDGRLAFSGGGHGVSFDVSRAAKFLGKHGRVTTLSASSSRSASDLPPGVTAYSDPTNPNVVGIDRDGLLVQTINPDLDPADSFAGEDDGLIHGGTIPAFSAGDSVTASAVETANLPPGTVAYSDPVNPNVFAKDADGLTVQAIDQKLSPARTSREEAKALLENPTGLPIHAGTIDAGRSLPDTLLESFLKPSSVNGPFNIVAFKSPALNSPANAAVSSAYDKAIAYVESLFDDQVTIYLDLDYGTFSDPDNIGGATPIVLGLSSPNNTYSYFRSLLINDSDSTSEAIVGQLPTTAPFFSADNGFSVTTPEATSANFVALGLSVPILSDSSNRSAYNTSFRRDATIKFNSSQPFDFDPIDGTAPSKVDFFSAAVHEIFHAMGLVSGVEGLINQRAAGLTTGQVTPLPMDFFKLKPVSQRGSSTFSNAPRLLSSGATYPRPVFFDGAFSPTGISNFGVTLSTGDVPLSTGTDGFGDGRQTSHWKDDFYTGRKIGIMDPTEGNAADVSSTRAIDQRALGLIGWDVSASGAVLSDAGNLRINGTSGANTISGFISTNTSGNKAFRAAISSGGVTVNGFFSNAQISSVTYDGKAGNDNITGTTRDETLLGGDGADNIDAAGGDDNIDGGAGDDTGLAGGNGEDTIVGNNGSDTIGGGAGTDTLLGGLSDDYIEGGTENDLIKGEGGIDGLYGNDGNDTFDAVDQIVDTAINGGPGSDTAYYDASPSEASKLSSIENGIPS